VTDVVRQLVAGKGVQFEYIGVLALINLQRRLLAAEMGASPCGLLDHALSWMQISGFAVRQYGGPDSVAMVVESALNRHQARPRIVEFRLSSRASTSSLGLCSC